MSTEPEGVWPGFSARRIQVPIVDPTTPTHPAGSQPLLDVSTQSPLAESNTGTLEAGPSRLPGAPFLSFPHSTPVNPPPAPSENLRTSHNNPFVVPPWQSPQPTAPAPEIRDLPPHLPDPTPAPTSDPQRDLAQAMLLLAQTLRLTKATSAASSGTPSSSSGCHNVREPDQFDGSDPSKLCSFFTQLELVFKARPRTFDTNEKKVTYAISYLKGMALAWFEPYLLERELGNPPEFLSPPYLALAVTDAIGTRARLQPLSEANRRARHGIRTGPVFQEELWVNFGRYDITGQAEHDLKNLQMADNQRIAEYITQFNRLATQGLPARLKDRISEVGKPDSLEELRNLAQSLDHRYWERKAEQARESSGGSKSSSGTSGKPTSESKSSSSSRPSQSSGSTPSTSSSVTPRASSGTLKTPSKQATKPYADKLGKDSKLTQEERQRCFANNLCLFCGGSGHVSAVCPKKTNTPAKGHAAQTSENPETPSDVQPESGTEEESKN
ncbi:hypothetical protein BN946_scf184899.g1 [Trametes cinnabarina]|uniref:Retrotransposon gag domain-containing protein n=1 Tax=Pycnoporus cinnabarinus TaxID=5643 RepID=A0A060SS41_PYCCI|nr:hypothetical protein BN946_scf184899.g1 [Trametes cinnabarina]